MYVCMYLLWTWKLSTLPNKIIHAYKQTKVACVAPNWRGSVSRRLSVPDKSRYQGEHYEHDKLCFRLVTCLFFVIHKMHNIWLKYKFFNIPRDKNSLENIQWNYTQCSVLKLCDYTNNGVILDNNRQNDIFISSVIGKVLVSDEIFNSFIG